MSDFTDEFSIHPQSEARKTLAQRLDGEFGPIRVQTAGGCMHVEWDPQAPVTPLGQLVFFAQFMEVSGHFTALCEDVPLERTSPNAPKVRDVLGTALLGVLCGQTRYAHLGALRFDPVNPGLLGMHKVASEDSVRRFFAALDEQAATRWLRGHFRQCWEGLLTAPWVLEIDTTIKPIYGHQEGATKGYNPSKPGRPSHAYHTYSRICLDVEVEEGSKHAATPDCGVFWRNCHARSGRWRFAGIWLTGRRASSANVKPMGRIIFSS